MVLIMMICLGGSEGREFPRKSENGSIDYFFENPPEPHTEKEWATCYRMTFLP